MKKYLIGFCTVVLIAGSAFMVAKAKAVKPAQNFYYRYTGPSVDPNSNLTPYQDTANWTGSSAGDLACLGGSFPCKVEVTQSTRNAYVSSIATAADVTNVTIAQKN